MSDMYGTVRSNEFRVRNVEAFKAWFFKYSFGDEIRVWVDQQNEDGSGTVSFGGEEQYPNAFPMVKIYDDDGYIEEVEEADLHKFVAELRAHLMPGEIFQVVASGAEKLRYVGFSELLAAEDSKNVRFHSVYSDDGADVLRERLAGSIAYSTMEQE